MGKGFDLGGLLKQAQERLASFQQEMGSKTVEASAGGGMVTAVVNGKLEVVRIRIDPTLLTTPDAEMIQDLVTAAVNEAIRAAQRMMADEVSKVTGGLSGMLPFKLPGMP
jgi:DNA-binding YbaB/EbfC family protein